jgi:hypothetical protein
VIREVVQVVEDVLAILEAEPQDVAWSRWDEPAEMVADLRDHVALLRRGDVSQVPELRLLFAPTGSLQEVAISSGWGERFLGLAARFDAASVDL